MNELENLQIQWQKWKEVSEGLKSIYSKLDATIKLDSTSNKKEWHYQIQLQMLFTKAEEYTAGYDEKIKQLQADKVI